MSTLFSPAVLLAYTSDTILINHPPCSSIPRFGATDVTEKADGSLVFHVDAPGLAKGDFNIEVSPEHVLTISGERKNESQGDDSTSRWSERSFSSFTRSFQLPPSAKVDQIIANATDGVLELTVPEAVDAPKEPTKIVVT
jgi:HSP20 family protein